MSNHLKQHNRNLIFNILGEGLWGFATAFHNINSVVPVILKNLDAPPALIGMIPGGFILLLGLPQLFAVRLFREHTDIRKLNITLHYLMAIPISLLVILFFIFQLSPAVSVWLYIVVWFLFSLSVGILIPVWADFLASASIPSHRGRFFGITFSFNSIMGMMGGVVLHYILENSSYSFPRNFGLGFVIMLFSSLLGTWFLSNQKMLQDFKPEAKPRTPILAGLKIIFKENVNFRNYLFARMLGGAFVMPLAFYAIDMQARYDLSISTAGTFTVFLVMGTSIFSLLFGFLSDKINRKIVVSFFFIGHLLALLIAIFLDTPWAGNLLFFCIGLAMGAQQSSFMIYVYEFAGEKGDRQLYYASVDSALAPVLLLYIIISGILVSFWSYQTIYWVSLFFIFFGLMYYISHVKTIRPNSA
jgi:MFS family permease